MRPTQFSDGIETVEGKQYQKSYIKTTVEFFVECPYCAFQIEIGDKSRIAHCMECNREFFAEFSLPNIL